MSLSRKLWAAIAFVALVVFGGSVLVSSLSARAYLQDQLLLKNLDNASALASTLSQMPKDPVMVELLIGSQFDTGHYERISLVDPQGLMLVDRASDVSDPGAPAWFTTLLPIVVAPGIAQVQDGWQQYGTLTLSSQTGFAYRSLWEGIWRLLGWFAVAVLGSGAAGTVLLRQVLRPLKAVVRQAEAIGERRFITTDEPATTEFRALVRAMNGMVRHVQQMLEDEARRLEQLRREAHYDAATGLLNRGHFLARARAVLEGVDAGAHGVLLIARLRNLEELNRVRGRAVTDVLIKRFAGQLERLAAADPERLSGRLNGSEFALLIPAEDDAGRHGQMLQQALQMVAAELDLAGASRLPVAAIAYQHADRLEDLLQSLDAGLAGAMSEGDAGLVVMTAERAGSGSARPTDLENWRRRLEASLVPGQLTLRQFPVVDAQGKMLHEECVARLRLVGEHDWLQARAFVPWLARLGKLARLDELVVDLALDSLRTHAGNLCINISAQSLNEPMLERIAATLAAEPELAARLAVEVPEHGALLHLEDFRRLCGLLRPLGCSVGIEHVGHQVSRIGVLHDLGVDYVKIDASFVSDIESNSANQVFLRGLAMIVHTIGIRVIAEGVSSEAELRKVIELGFDGATGPGIV